MIVLIKEAKMFTLLVDETKYVSKTEQLSIVIRFVDTVGSIHEHFLTFIDTASLTAEGLTKHIFDTLEHYRLDPQWIVAQCYDGASVMSGHVSRSTKPCKTGCSTCPICTLLCTHTEFSVVR